MQDTLAQVRTRPSSREAKRARDDIRYGIGILYTIQLY